MRKINFIENLVIEDKIKLVDISNEISEFYSQKSNNCLKAAKL